MFELLKRDAGSKLTQPGVWAIPTRHSLQKPIKEASIVVAIWSPHVKKKKKVMYQRPAKRLSTHGPEMREGYSTCESGWVTEAQQIEFTWKQRDVSALAVPVAESYPYISCLQPR